MLAWPFGCFLPLERRLPSCSASASSSRERTATPFKIFKKPFQATGSSLSFFLEANKNLDLWNSLLSEFSLQSWRLFRLLTGGRQGAPFINLFYKFREVENLVSRELPSCWMRLWQFLFSNPYYLLSLRLTWWVNKHFTQIQMYMLLWKAFLTAWLHFPSDGFEYGEGGYIHNAKGMGRPHHRILPAHPFSTTNLTFFGWKTFGNSNIFPGLLLNHATPPYHFPFFPQENSSRFLICIIKDPFSSSWL